MNEKSELEFWQNEADYWNERAAKLEVLVRFILAGRVGGKQFLTEAAAVVDEKREAGTDD